MKKFLLLIPLFVILSSCDDDNLQKEEKTTSQKQEVIKQPPTENEIMGVDDNSSIIDTLASAYIVGKVIDGVSEISEELIENNNDSKRYDYWKNDSYKMKKNYENNYNPYKKEIKPPKKDISAPPVITFKKANVPQKKSKCIFCGSSKKSSWGSSKSSGSSFFRSSSFSKKR